ESNAPPGPACEMEAPEATNRPVPMEPPMAIMERCRAFSSRRSVGLWLLVVVWVFDDMGIRVFWTAVIYMTGNGLLSYSLPGRRPPRLRLSKIPAWAGFVADEIAVLLAMVHEQCLSLCFDHFSLVCRCPAARACRYFAASP